MSADQRKLPKRLIIGVTGHRSLATRDAWLVDLVNRALVRWVRHQFPNRPVVLLTALAEGADRLVAGIAAERLGADLAAVLPLPEEVYVKDFATSGSKRRFKGFLAAARKIYRAPALRHDQLDPRVLGYAWSGAFIARRCDVLVAVWDERPARGPGGTAEVVGWFLEQRTPPYLKISSAPALSRAGGPRWLVQINPETRKFIRVAEPFTPPAGAALVAAASAPGRPSAARPIRDARRKFDRERD